MGLEHYGFAFFVAVLLCGLLLIGKALFSDTKRQNRLLDEKEAKLLKLYSSLEDVMEEFYDSVEASKRDIDEKTRRFEAEQSKAAASAVLEKSEKRAPQLKTRQPKPADEPISETFQITLEKAQEEGAPEPPARPQMHGGRTEEILNRNLEGLSQVQIAQELGITQNEVALVLELSKKA